MTPYSSATNFSSAAKLRRTFFGLDAVRHAEVAGAAEAVTGDQRQVIFQRLLAERLCVVLQRLREDVERAVRLDDGEAQRDQLVVDQVHVRLVDGQVAGHVKAALDGHLDEGRRAVMAGAAGDLAAHRHDVGGILAAGVGRHIADTLARHTQTLGEGVAGKRIIVEFSGVGRDPAAERNLAVRLVGNQEDVVAVLGGRLGQKGGQLLQGLLTVGGAAGVIGRVDEYGGGVLVHELRERLKVDLKVRAPRRRHAQGKPRALDVRLVLGEERRKRYDVLPGHSNAAHRMGQRAGCAGGHKDMVAGVVHAKAAVQAFGHLARTTAASAWACSHAA